MYLGRTTLSKFLIQQLTDIPGASDLGALLVDVAAAVKAISAMTAKGALGGYLGEHGGKNVQGETQQKLDVLAHEIIVRSCEWGGLLAGMVSEDWSNPTRCRSNIHAVVIFWRSIRSTALRTPM